MSRRSCARTPSSCSASPPRRSAAGSACCSRCRGVGARVALAILSTLSAGELQNAIANGDKAMVARTSGVGPKLAQRIVTELADKAGPALGPSGSASGAALPGGVAADAASALANLGFKPAQAGKVVSAALEELGAGAQVEDVVRVALKKAAR